MKEFLKRTWAVINIDNLDYNINNIRAKLPDETKIMAVVKADGYGHGDKIVAKELLNQGVDFFAVSNLDEAHSLRDGGIYSDILILGFTPVGKADELASLNISQTVFSFEYAELLNDYCRKKNIKVKVHIKIDTGMSRLGVLQSESHSAFNEVRAICSLKNLDVQGIFTHLSSADCLDGPSVEYTNMQRRNFNSLLAELKENNIHIPLSHLQNSAGISFYNDAVYEYARAGIVMYGVAPSDETLPYELKPVMELKSVVSMVKEIDADTAVSYGRTFVSDRKMRIATVPIGYADGYPRHLSNKGEMIVHGKRARVIGNVCMDQLMLDVSDIPEVKMGDIVTVVGHDGDEFIGFDEVGRLAGSIPYEMMCLIARRVPRVYTRNGNTFAVVEYMQGYLGMQEE